MTPKTIDALAVLRATLAFTTVAANTLRILNALRMTATAVATD